MTIDETPNLTEDQRCWFHETYAKWHEVMRPYDGHGPAALFRDRWKVARYGAPTHPLVGA